jgi:hypothetical protein
MNRRCFEISKQHSAFAGQKQVHKMWNTFTKLFVQRCKALAILNNIHLTMLKSKIKVNRPSSAFSSSFDSSDLQRASCFLDRSISSWAFRNKVLAFSFGHKEKSLMATWNLSVLIICLENHPVECYTEISYFRVYIALQRDYWYSIWIKIVTSILIKLKQMDD